MARSGYLNLLQPQDKRSSQPGDSAEAVAARRRVLEAGYGEVFANAFVALIRKVSGAILDVGCGEGYHLDLFRRTLDTAEAHGTDISTQAVDAAAKRYRQCTFVVANADRFLPYEDESFAVLTSITARSNAPEFRRVLRADGRLVVALPGPEDLIELREAVLGERKSLDRTKRSIEVMEGFVLLRHERVTRAFDLSPNAIADIMRSTYRGLRRNEQARIAEIGAMKVTLSRDLLLFERS